MIDAGIELLKHFEGWRDQAYPDPATGGDPWTVGYGFTHGVKPGDYMTPEEGEARLKHEVQDFERQVTDMLTHGASDQQLAAMVCLAYNIGPAHFRDSTVLRRHNTGEFYAAANAFALWNKAAGRVMAGLTRRREAERALYLTGKWHEAA